MHYGELKNCDIANGEGVRISLFVSGCTNHCKNCFQPETWDFEYGKLFDKSVEDKIIEMLRPDYINGFSLLGGEPFEPQNQRDVLPLIKKIKQIYPKKTIWVYSGFTFEELRTPGSHPNCEVTEDILRNIDILVDGRFVEEKKDISLRFRGSSNQRIIDMPNTLKSGNVVLWDEPQKNV